MFNDEAPKARMVGGCRIARGFPGAWMQRVLGLRGGGCLGFLTGDQLVEVVCKLGFWVSRFLCEFEL